MAEWVNAYQTACSGATINYQANGSGAGVTDFINKQTAFAGSDSALKDADRPAADARCAAGPAIDIPMVGGAIVMAYNVSGVSKLTLPSAVIAGIFANTITKWNDPAIVAANAGVTLPDATIAQFHRSDSSGTTDNFTKYLTAVAPTVWTYGTGKEWKAPGGQGSKGSDGMANSVSTTANSIGYMELSFAQGAKLATASVDNGGGAVEATSENAAMTISGATIKGTGNDLALSIDYTGKTGYPIVLVTYEITCEKGLDSSLLPLTKGFLTYTSSDDGQSKLSAAGYVPITGDLLSKVRAAVAAIS
jgi:phosphate transport system substrate-binding protein